MRTLSFILLLLLQFSLCSANLNNTIWQGGSGCIAAGYAERYEFEDSIFKYYNSEFLSLPKAYVLSGHYNITGDSIRLSPDYLVAYKPIGFNCDFMTTTEGGWEIVCDYENPRLDTIYINTPAVVLSYDFTQDSIVIDNKVFYKVTK